MLVLREGLKISLRILCCQLWVYVERKQCYIYEAEYNVATQVYVNLL